MLTGGLEPHLALTLGSQVAPPRRGEGRRPISDAALGFEREHRTEQQRHPVVARRADRREHVGVLIEVGGRRGSGEIVALTQDRNERVDVGADAGDLRAAQRPSELAGGFDASRRVGDHLGDQRVVVGGDLGAIAHTGVDSDTIADREATDAARGRHPSSSGIFSDHTYLDRMTGHGDVALRHRQRFARGDTQLQLDEVEAGHRLGHGVLDLQASVDFEERDRRLTIGVGADHELHSARTLVADVPGKCDRTITQCRYAPRPRCQPMVTLRRSSGCDAGSSTRARPGGRRCRAGRRTPAPRRGDHVRGTAR